MTGRVPLVTAAAGCGGSGRELARFGDLLHLDAVHLGPVGADDPAAPGAARRPVLSTPSGLVHRPARGLAVGHVVQDLLPWCRARGLRVVLAVRGTTVGDVVAALQALRRSLDFGTVTGVEVDLATTRGETRPSLAGLTSAAPATTWSADPQATLKLLAAVREQLPRDLLLLAKLGGECPDPVATSRAAVGGGARALVLSGSVPALYDGHHLVGPATGAVTLGLLRRIREAMDAARVPEVPLVAVGGVSGVPAALAARAAGATGVQLGSALLADPALLWEVHRALLHAEPVGTTRTGSTTPGSTPDSAAPRPSTASTSDQGAPRDR